jgi:outer membrane murein-binding lipoprotein Lpp
MKSIRLFFAAFALPLALALAGCSKEYDDTELRNKISSLESRIAELESLKTTMSGIQTTVANLEKKLSVTAVKTDPANGNVTISFSDGYTATLTSGKVVSVK